MKNLHEVISTIEATNPRSAWTRGVKAYALELLEEQQAAVNQGWRDEDEFCNRSMIEKALLNGARSWVEYSWGGSSLIYNIDIAERLCTPSEYCKVTRNGETHNTLKDPNPREQWLDTQARALFQACNLIVNTFLN